MRSRLSVAFLGPCGLLVAALLVTFTAPARAAESAETGLLTAYANVDLAGADGPRSWLDGGTGKGRFGHGDGTDFRVHPSITEAGIALQPHFTWSLSALVSAVAQHRPGKQIDLSEAYLRYRPLPFGAAHLTVRAGLFWPPVSLEHAGGEWPVVETVTPSAINSWIGDEVKVGGIEGSVTTLIGAHRLSLTVAGFGLNDTSGTLLTFRGWALHDEKATAFALQPLPTLNAFMQFAQAPKTRPVIELDNRPGWYAKLAWAPPGPFQIEYLHYDNRGDPEAVNATLQWGWRTTFDDVGAILDVDGKTRLTAQAMRGKTVMGYPENGVRWVYMNFRSAFLLATRQVDWAGRAGSVSARFEAFDTRNAGSEVGPDDDEKGWAATAATRWPIGRHAALFAEAVHIDSRRDARLRDGIAPRQRENIVRLTLRLRGAIG